MHPRIRPSRSVDSNRSVEDPAQSGFETALDGIVLGLQLPAEVCRPVVLDRQLYPHQFVARLPSAKVSATQTAANAARRVLSNTHHSRAPSASGSALILIASCPTASMIESGAPCSARSTPGVPRSVSSHSSPDADSEAETVSPVP